MAEPAGPTSKAHDAIARACFEHGLGGMLLVDDERRCIDANPAVCALLGLSREQVLSRRLDDLVSERDRPSIAAGWTDFLEHGSRSGECEIVVGDGSRRQVKFHATASVVAGCHLWELRDPGERRDAQDRREHEDEREFLDAVLESLEAGVVACRADGELSLFNRATREMHGLPEEPLDPSEWAGHYDLFGPDGRKMRTADIPLVRALRGERVRDAELVIAPRGRPPRIVLCNGRALESSDGRPLGAVVVMHDVTARRQAEGQLAHQAMHDPVTDLPNRALLLDRLGHALAAARRDAGAGAVAALVVDLDHFKLVNDSLGHPAGDELLVAVAARLQETLRSGDTVARPGTDTVAHLGGDEFALVCERVGERDATLIAERIINALHPPFSIGGEQVFAAASIGIALSSDACTAESQLMDAATALDRAKVRGRGRYELFDEALRARVVDRVQRENQLRRAIADDELRLYYQPIVTVPDGHIIGAEALVRWEHPERGLLAPASFIELAEDSGLIVPLGAWVLQAACRQIATWVKRLGHEQPLRVSINVSVGQLAEPHIVELIGHAVHEAAIDPSRLALEITETVLMEHGEAPVATLQELKRLGTPLVLDDFGTGYSSLSYLQRLPIGTLKLDRSFVTPLTRTGGERKIAAAVAQMAHALGMEIVAEGVETAEQLQILADLSYDQAQGYLFARPLAAAAVTELLEATAAGGSPCAPPQPGR